MFSINGRDYLTVEDVARTLNYTTANVTHLIRTRKLEAMRRGRRYIIKPEALKSFLTEREAAEFLR